MIKQERRSSTQLGLLGANGQLQYIGVHAEGKVGERA